MPSKDVTCRMDEVYMAAFLCSLPSDALVTMKLDYIERPIELMARDFPREGRRFTNLTSGTEWFITPESLQNVGVQSVVVHPFTINRY
jgi:hypothetical protein